MALAWLLQKPAYVFCHVICYRTFSSLRWTESTMRNEASVTGCLEML